MRLVTAHAVGTEQSEQVLEQFFPGVQMNAPAATPFEVTLNSYAGPDDLLFTEYTVDGAMFVQTESPSGVMISLSDIRGTVGFGRDLIDTSQPYVVPDRAFADCDRAHTQIVGWSEATMDHHLLMLEDRPAPGRFRFTGASPLTEQLGDHWRSAVAMTQTVMSSEAIDAPLVSSSVTDFVIRTALACFPHNRQQPDTAGAMRATAAVKRARAFIDDHAHEPITLTDIAQAARISSRHLQGEFRRHYETTPMAYLRLTRLALAHEALRHADPGADGVTVAEIARAAGFAHLGRFAADYLQTYGEHPRATLNR